MNFTITNYTDIVKYNCVRWKEWKISNKQFSKGPEVWVGFRKNKIISISEKLMRIKNWNKLNYSWKKSKWFFFYESKTFWWTVNHSMTLTFRDSDGRREATLTSRAVWIISNLLLWFQILITNMNNYCASYCSKPISFLLKIV